MEKKEIFKKLKKQIETRGISRKEVNQTKREVKRYIDNLEKNMKFKISTSVKEYLISRR
jgi:uncharacterized FlaG/YvyC family protein